jgi:hypothetical protein
MDRSARLHLVGRSTYYLGWIALVCGGVVHLNVATALFLALRLTQRNLFEVSVMCFLICIASELRARDSAAKETPNIVKRSVAA